MQIMQIDTAGMDPRAELLAEASAGRAFAYERAAWIMDGGADALAVLRAARIAELDAADVVDRWIGYHGEESDRAIALRHSIMADAAPSLDEATRRADEATRLARAVVEAGRTAPSAAREWGRLAGNLEAAERLRRTAAAAGARAIGAAELAR
jgi:hypothetical protein